MAPPEFSGSSTNIAFGPPGILRITLIFTNFPKVAPPEFQALSRRWIVRQFNRGDFKTFRGWVPSSKNFLAQTRFTSKMHKDWDFLRKIGLFVQNPLLRTGAWHPLLHFIIAPALMPPLDHLVCTWLLYETLPVLKWAWVLSFLTM